MIRKRNGAKRVGLSLMEVLTALAIFLSALIVIGQLVTSSGDRALDVQLQGRAAQLCQSKLAEVLAGSVQLSGSQSDVPFDEDPDWHWSVDVEQQNVANLFSVQVRVNRQRPDGSKVECTLNQMLFDPTQRGSTLDTPPAPISTTTAAATGAGSNSSSSGSSSQSASGSTSGPAASGAASGRTPRPASSSGTPSKSGSSSGSGKAPSTSPASGTPKSGTPKSGASKGGS